MDDSSITPGQQALFRAVHHVALPAGSHDVVRCLDTERVLHLPRGAAGLLARCARFAHLEVHARGDAAVIGRLRKLASLGLLETPSMVRGRLARLGGGAPAVEVTRVTVPTRDRVAGVRRLLAALGQTPVRLHVQDAQAAEALHGHGVEVVTPALLLRWASALTAASGASAAVRFALGLEGGGLLTGANRNAALLGAAGGGLLCVDDDVLPRAVSAAERRAALAGSGDPTEVRFFDSVEAATAQAAPVDLLETVGRWLGRRLDGEEAAALELSASSAACTARLAGGASVGAVSFGVAGDPGWGRGVTALMLGARPGTGLEQHYPARLRARAVQRMASAPTLCAGPYWMATAGAVDAREVLPPHFPRHRNAEGPWAVLLQQVTAGLVVHLPLGVVHLPVVSRSLDPAALAGELERCRLADVLAGLFSELPPSGSDREAGLVAAGHHLLTTASLPMPALQRRVQAVHHRQVAAMLQRLQGALRAGPQAPWTPELKACIGGLRTALLGRAPPAEYDGSGAWSRLQADLRAHGELLLAWPALWRAALAHPLDEVLASGH